MSELKQSKGCKYDTDGDGNCHIHPKGCPKEPEKESYQALEKRLHDLEDAVRFEQIHGFLNRQGGFPTIRDRKFYEPLTDKRKNELWLIRHQAIKNSEARQ